MILSFSCSSSGSGEGVDLKGERRPLKMEGEAEGAREVEALGLEGVMAWAAEMRD